MSEPDIGTYHLRNRQARTQAAAQLAERVVADASHGGQKNRWLEPMDAKLHT